MGELDASAWRGRLYSGGWAAGEGGDLAVIEPATGAEFDRTSLASPADVARAARAASNAQGGWAVAAPAARADALRGAASFFERNRAAISEIIVRETGAVPAKADFEISVAIGELYEAASMATQPRGLLLPSEAAGISMARRVPHGVVGVIAPFNFPLILSIRAVAPALATGNAVLLKPDPQTAVSGGMVIAQAFAEARLPENLLHVLPGGADVGEALVNEPAVRMIAFTGSTAVGRRIGAMAGAALKKVSLELGGKNALIILDDADLDLAASNAAWGAFLHQGQICMATGRVLVDAKVAAAFIAKLAETAERLPVGDPFRDQVALGPLINEKQAARVDTLLGRSIEAGARVRAGGTRRGLFFRPTVLDEVVPGMPVWEEEVFGPVAPVTVFRDLDEAVQLANDTDYGLSAGVITASIGRGLEVAAQLRTGLVHVNDQTVADDPAVPFGGSGSSGNGSRVGGPANWEEFTQWQWMTVKGAPPRYPF